jgi:phage/plasmid-associated DNA primase
MWRICKSAGRPWPTLCEDDVVDYLVMEAVALKVQEQDAEQQKKAERERWKKETEHLKQFQ